MLALYKKIFGVMTGRERRNFGLLSALLVVVSFFEAFGLASIMPFLAVLADPTIIERNQYLGFLYNYFGFTSDFNFLIALGGLVFVVIVFGMSLKLFSLYFLIRFGTRRVYSISMRLLKSYLSQPYVWFLLRDSSQLSKSILSEVDQLLAIVLLPALKVVAQIALSLAMIVVIIIVNPVISLVLTVVLVTVYGALFAFTRTYLAKIGQERVIANGRRFQVASEAFGSVKDVKLLGLERHFSDAFHPAARACAHLTGTSQIVRELPRWVFEAIAFGGMLILILVLLNIHQGVLADVLPILGFYAIAGFRLLPAFQQIYQNLSSIRYGAAALDSIHRDLQEIGADQSVFDAERGALTPLTVKNQFRLKDTVYRYPGADQPSLKGVDMTIRANTTVGLVGGTGAGKTTLVDVMLGLLQPETGAFLVDGTEVGADTLGNWQRAIGYVPQHIFITNDTVVGNIAFGVSPDQVDMAAVEQAARMAALHQFVIDELPEGYDTVLGERGIRLSGGQRQRIGIARALYRNPSVLIFDEATSALDNLTEKAVMEAIYSLATQKTIVLIAHRLSTVERCDKIFMLGEGRVIAEGTYQELLQNSPQFRALAGRETSNFENSETVKEVAEQR